MQETGNTNHAVITVVRDPQHPLGKRFDLNPDGVVTKTANVRLSLGLAIQYKVESHQALADLLAKVGADPHAAIINAVFPDIPIGEEFAIVSEREIESHLGIPAEDRDRQKGVHTIDYNGTQIKAVGRFKENVSPSAWQLLDRDVDRHTPAELAGLSMPDWLRRLAAIFPNVDKLSYVETPSTSSRVLKDGEPVGGGNGHVWILGEHPEAVERIRAAMIPLAAQAGLTWMKPRYSRKEADKVIGQSLCTLVDPSVWTPGRLVFDGKPTVSDGLTVAPLIPKVHEGELQALDLSTIVMPDADAVRTLTRDAGVEMDLVEDRNGLRIRMHDLTLDTELETEDSGTQTVRELLDKNVASKVRCQTPFRASESFAAFYDTNDKGMPFVHDVGTGITHWLADKQAAEAQMIRALGVAHGLIAKVKDDSAAVLEPEAVSALALIKQHDPAAHQRLRNKLKAANRNVPLNDLDRAVKTEIESSGDAQTHHGFAEGLLEEFTAGQYAPVGHQGGLFVLDPNAKIWMQQPEDALAATVAKLFDGAKHCSRAADYKAIAAHAIQIAGDAAFFDQATVGIACPSGFYRVEGNEFVCDQLKPEHRQRVRLAYAPIEMATPMFMKFLEETFGGKCADESQQQIDLVQEIAGAVMLGLLPRYQKAILFYDPYGRAGKGTLEQILRGLVPPEFVTAVSPFKWDRDYFVAALAGSRLNVVGELPDGEAIPAAYFKSVIGGDLITGRHPTHRPFTFKNEAAHVFMSNHLITTKDHTEAFFARWIIIEFPNSRLLSGLPLDPNLAQRIIDAEMPGIASWALQGAARLLRNGRFSPSMAHDRLMDKWRHTSNSLEEFIHEACQLGSAGNPAYRTRRSDFYRLYTAWCKDNGRRPFAKSKVTDLLAHNVGLGIALVEIDGYETFKGVSIKQSVRDEFLRGIDPVAD